MYSINEELQARSSGFEKACYIADVRFGARVNQIFRDEAPHVVFHAAALKHVPMVEQNPTEGVLSNVIGTRNVAQAVLKSGALAMVQVSTDKAVNPTSVMGATKRLAELYCQSMDVQCGHPSPDAALPRFITVRFGNVLGSSGSVVPLFQRQIEGGGPITITHPDIRRFFMTIREASELVLQACSFGLREGSERGAIFVLDMGQQVRIVDLALQMLRLMGKEPGRDVCLKFIGLRPGEKLYEELFDDSENQIDGPAKGLLVARSAPYKFDFINNAIEQLEESSYRGDQLRVVQQLASIVPGFRIRRQGTEEAA
jgi:O-antigen biosynthesis protein WbqV